MELDFIGIIEDGMWGATPSTNEVKAALDAGAGQDLTLNIASEGGSVFEAFKIAALLDNYKGKTTAKGFGLVASAATLIMSACDDKKMTKGSFYMIHNSWSYTAGNKEQLQQEADLMGKIDAMMAEIYTNCIEKSGKLVDGDKDKTKKKVLKMMKEETWLTAQEALDMGLIDAMMDEEDKQDETMQAQAFGRIRAQASNFKHIPNEILNNSNMSNDKKGFFATMLKMLGITPTEAKAELEAIEAPEAVEVEATETPEAVTATAEETKEVEDANTELETLKAELAAKDKEIEALKASVKTLEVQAKSKLPITNEGKGEKKKTGVITPEMEAHMNEFTKKIGLTK